MTSPASPIRPSAWTALLLMGLAAAAAAQMNTSVTPPRLRPPPPDSIVTNILGRFELTPLTPERDSPADGSAILPGARNLLYEGLILVQDEDYSNAVPVLEKTIEQDPSLVAAWEALGWSYWKLGREDDAETLWNRLLLIAPDNPMPHNLLGSVATFRKDLERAETRFRKSLELDPHQFEIRLNLAQTLAWQSKAEEAELLLKALIAEEPDRTDIRIELAHTAYMLQHYEESAEHWKVVCEILPDNPGFLVEWARAMLYAGELEEAGRQARKAAELDGGSLRALNVLADIAQIANHPEEAVPEIRKLLDRTEDLWARSQIRARIVGLLHALHEKDAIRYPLKPIIAETRAALDEDPRNISLMVFLAEILMMDRRHEEAIRIFETIHREINPHNHRVMRALFELRLTRREFDLAERLIEEIYETIPSDLPYRFMDLARLEFAKGNYYEAVRNLDRMEREGMKGAVYSLLYHGLAITEWEPGLPVRLFRDHILFLKRAGFRFITPDEIPAYLDSRKTLDASTALPGPYRFLRWIRYLFTGEEPPRNEAADLESHRPDRVVCVTFDDGLRTSFRLGTPVADEFGVPFAMHVPVGNIARRDYGICSWEEIRRYRESGVWTIGSHAIDSGILEPGYEDGYTIPPLPNRLWVADKNRPESLRDWSRRVRAEMHDSRAIILEKLGLDPDKGVRFIAYAYGEIGQMEGCNIRGIGNVPKSIIHEASLSYRVGFVQSQFGYATSSDNPLVYTRHEPQPTDTGEAVLKHALENHPVFLARRMKAELAALQGKPHMAHRMMALLERDGYPAASLRNLRDVVERSIAGRTGRPQLDETPGKGESLIVLSNPYVGIDGFLSQANRQIEQSEIGVKAGLNLAPRLRLEGRYAWGNVLQEVVSNRWTEVKETKVSETTVIVTGVNEGIPIDKREKTITYATENVQTNVITRHHFETDYTYAGGRLEHTIRDGSLLDLRFGIKDYRAEEERKNVPVGGLTHLWKPAPGVDFATAYEHDVVPSGRRVLLSDSLGIRTIWRVRDGWEINAFGRYSYYSDTNALIRLSGSSMWLVGERQNIFAGIQYELTTMDDYSQFYWSPYWEERFYVTVRFDRAFPSFFAAANAKAGVAREKGRPEDLEKWRALKARGDREGWYPGDKPGSDWEPSVGLDGVLRRRIGNHWELEGQAACSFYSDYSEFLIGGSLLYQF